MNKNILVSVGIVVALVLGLFGAIKSLTVVQTPPVQLAGSVASPDLPTPYFSFGGNRVWGSHTDSLQQATTTACALISPNGTTTLESFDVRFDVASSTTATVVDLAKSTNPTASSTVIASPTSISSNAQATIIATTTGIIFAPNTYVLAKVSGGVGTYTPTGMCQAKWRQISY